MIDRTARNQFHEALYSYMTGSIDNLSLDRYLDAIHSPDRTLDDLRFRLWSLYDDYQSHPITVTPQGWQTLIRILAFLRTDYEFAPTPSPSLRAPSWSSRLPGLRRVQSSRAVARFDFPGVAIALAFFLVDAFLLVLCFRINILAVFPLWVIWGLLCFISPRFIRRQFQHLSPWYPFAAEAQWLESRQLIADLNLPNYDPALHASRTRIRNPLETIILYLGSSLTAPILIPTFYLLSAYSPRADSPPTLIQDTPASGADAPVGK